MGIIQKIKGFFFNEEEKQEGESQQVNSSTTEQNLSTSPADSREGKPTGSVCDYCQSDIYEHEIVRTVANKKLHKKCSKKLMKQAKQQLWG